MKRIIALFLLVFLVAGCAKQLSAVDRAHRTTLHLSMDTGSCSGTAIGPHAILSASHCFAGMQSLSVNGVPVVVADAISDGHDHTILIVDQTFLNWAQIGPAPAQGDQVFILGNPGELTDLYRGGHMSGSAVDGNTRVSLYDLQDFPGDSGSGIFDEQGRLVGVISIFMAFQDRGARIQFAGSFGLAFTPAQLALAATVDEPLASP
jgi:hypothetical protein